MTVAGADWSGAGGAAALQTALQTAVDTAVGAGNATATVSGGNGSPLVDRYRPDRHASAAGRRRRGATTGFATLLGNTAVGSDGVGGRQFFTGTDAATLAVSRRRRRATPPRSRPAPPRGGPLDGSNALDLADLATSQTGADAVYRQMIVQLGVDTQTATNRDQIQQSATTEPRQRALAAVRA